MLGLALIVYKAHIISSANLSKYTINWSKMCGKGKTCLTLSVKQYSPPACYEDPHWPCNCRVSISSPWDIWLAAVATTTECSRISWKM